jgi:hypothetical protein
MPLVSDPAFKTFGKGGEMFKENKGQVYERNLALVSRIPALQDTSSGLVSFPKRVLVSASNAPHENGSCMAQI